MTAPLYGSLDEAVAAIPAMVRGLAPEDPTEMQVILRHHDAPFELVAATWRAPREGQIPLWCGVFVWRAYPRGVASVGAAASPQDELLVESSKHCRFLLLDDQGERWWLIFGTADQGVGSLVATFSDATTITAAMWNEWFLLGGRLRGLRSVQVYSKNRELLETIRAQGSLGDVRPPSDSPTVGPVHISARADATIEVIEEPPRDVE